MKGVLFIGGEGPDKKTYETYVERADFIIAADSGIELAERLGVVPDMLVGDMDSISNRKILEKYESERIKTYPRDKDETDTEIGIRIFREMGYNSIVMVGGGGGRLDHLLGIVNLFERSFKPTKWITSREVIFLIEGDFFAYGWKGSTVSLFPLGERVEGMESSGLKWPINGLKWERGYYGISNFVISDELYITVRNARILLIKNLEGVS